MKEEKSVLGLSTIRRNRGISLEQIADSTKIGIRSLEAIEQGDFRNAARQVRANPGFTAVAVLSLALGVGANSAIFQLVDAVRLRTLPVVNPQELVTIDFAKGSSRSGNWSTRSARFTSVLWEHLHGLTEPFTGTIAWSAARFNLAPAGEARNVEGQYVSGDFFRVLGVQAWIRRTFPAEDAPPGAGPPAPAGRS